MNNEPNFEGEKMKMPTEEVYTRPENVAMTETRGAFIVVLFIALAVILLGLFYWYNASTKIPLLEQMVPTRPTAEMNNEPESTTAEAQADSLGVVSTSDELDAIEADLESTNLNELEAELIQIDAELEASIETP